MKKIKIPKDFAVQPLKPGAEAKDRVTCGTCGLAWDDAIPTSWTPAPSGRCPFEYFHIYEPEPAPVFSKTFEALIDIAEQAAELECVAPDGCLHCDAVKALDKAEVQS